MPSTSVRAAAVEAMEAAVSRSRDESVVRVDATRLLPRRRLHVGRAPRPRQPRLGCPTRHARGEKVVWRWGGYLFVTATEAEEFAKAEMVFHSDDPPHARQAFRTSAWTGSASMCTSEASEDKAGQAQPRSKTTAPPNQPRLVRLRALSRPRARQGAPDSRSARCRTRTLIASGPRSASMRAASAPPPWKRNVEPRSYRTRCGSRPPATYWE